MPINIDDPYKNNTLDIKGLAEKYFSQSDYPTFVRIAQAESSGNPYEINKNKNGTRDHGLFQINDVNVPSLTKVGIIKSKDDLYDPEINTKAAAFLHKQQGLKPWNSSKAKWGENATSIDDPYAMMDDPYKKGTGKTASTNKEWLPVSALKDTAIPSVARVTKGVGETLLRPWRAASSLGEFSAGGVEAGMTALGLPSKKISPEEQAFTTSVIDPLKQSIREPSDIPRRVWNYTIQNPVEQTMNISAGLGAVGKLTNMSALTKASELTNPMGLLTKPIGTMARGLTNKFTSLGVSPAQAERAALSAETGVNLSPADITGKKSQAILEMQLRENIGSAGRAEKFQNQKLSDVSRYADKFQSQIGGPESALGAGQIAQESSWPRYRAFQKNASNLKNKIAVEGNTSIETNNLTTAATDELDELGKLESPTIKRILKITQQGMIPETTTQSAILDIHGKPISSVISSKPTYTWDQLRRDQSELGKMIQSTTDRNKKRILYQLQNAMDEDIIAFGEKSGNPEIKEQIDAFKQYYREGNTALPGIRVWNDRQIVNMMRTNSPEDIVQKFIKAKANQSDIVRLKQVTGSKGFQAIKQAWLEDMFTKGEEQSFNPNKFVTAYDKYKQGGNLDVMLDKGEKVGLDKLYDISKVINTATKIAGNPSGTGRMYLNAAIHWVAHPVINTITQIGANRLADLYFNNPTFRNFLIKGIESSSKTGQAIGAANALAQIAAQSATTNVAYQSSKPKIAIENIKESKQWKELGE